MFFRIFGHFCIDFARSQSGSDVVLSFRIKIFLIWRNSESWCQVRICIEFGGNYRDFPPLVISESSFTSEWGEMVF